MKRKLFSFLFSLLLLSVLVLPGCSAKSAATPEQFQKAAEEAGYTVEEQDAGTLVSIHSATKEDSTSTLMFYVCSSESEAKSALSSLRQTMPSNQKHLNSSYYTRYTAEDSETYYTAIRMGNTILTAAVEPDDQGTVDTVVSALGY
ncbi:MAG TPA: hypothetical protein IAA80_01535 [Candidatus Gallacutalibacter pullistercoris]|nr:hypothetical protein [Candidatus Gallacutalibacter pullistercoris]